MGWTTGFGSRRELIHHLTQSEPQRVCLKHCLRGNCLWTVWTYKRAYDDAIITYIGLDLLQRFGKDCWGYKDIDESVHPYYYSCPLSYLTLVPDDSEGVCLEWREKVRAYHSSLHSKRKSP